ncbi:DUF1757 domain-containing protein [archaeon]|nr:MAG: DUF1757 domain-containing protein [archaeon]
MNDSMDYFRKMDSSKYTAQDMPEYPARVLTNHCLMKGLQAGSVMGTFVITPIYTVYRKVPLPLAWKLCAFPASLFGSSIGLALLMGKEMHGDLDVDGVDDRAFRIAQNKDQTRLDGYSIVGAAVGATVGALVGKFGVTTILPAATSGIAMSVVYFTLEKMARKKNVE